MLSRWARLVERFRWWFAIAALVLGGVAAVLGPTVTQALKPGGFDDPTAESVEAQQELADLNSIDVKALLVLVTPGGDVTALPKAQAAVAAVAAAVRHDPDVRTVLTNNRSGVGGLVSTDHRTALIVGIWKTPADDEKMLASRRIQASLASNPHVQVGGYMLVEYQLEQQASDDLTRAELIAIPILFVLLLFIFRSVTAALIPVVLGGMSILVTFLILQPIAHSMYISTFALNIIDTLGLGLAIDYGLLMISRYREELRNDPTAAVRQTVATAGRTVLFSAITITAAMAALVVFPQQFLVSMGIGGGVICLTSAALALTVLPAVLSILGPRIDAIVVRELRDERETSGRWFTFASLVMRRPVAVAVVTTGVLILLSVPFLHIQFTSVDASVLSPAYSARQVDDVLQSRFPAGFSSPVVILATTTDGNQVSDFARRVGAAPGIEQTISVREIGANIWEIDALLQQPPLTDSSKLAVTTIRGMDRPFPIMVTGVTAIFMDIESGLVSHLPQGLLIIALGTFAVLFVATGSVILPVKALLMNVLSLGATFGSLAYIFQDGRLQTVLGYSTQSAIAAPIPVLLFAVAFGLNTDYGVFLLTRIKEARDGGAGNKQAVAMGLERTGRIVSAAAVLFCTAMGALVTSSVIVIKEIGFGAAMAVIIDVSIVRILLVPALMAILGEWNWWAPQRLRMAMRRIHLGGG